MEENKFRELRLGAQRELVERQTTKLASATQHEATMAKAQSVRMRSVKQEIKGKQNFLAAYDEKIAQLTQRAHQVGGATAVVCFNLGGYACRGRGGY